MGFLDATQRDLTEALKARDELRLSTLRMVKAALKYKEVEKMQPLDDSEAMGVLRTLLKQRRESVEQFTKGGRLELAEKEGREIAIIEAYLPAAASDEEIAQAIAAAISETGANSPKQMGAVIKAAKARLSAKSVDGKLLSERVRARLEQL